MSFGDGRILGMAFESISSGSLLLRAILFLRNKVWPPRFIYLAFILRKDKLDRTGLSSDGLALFDFSFLSVS
jgi:hypothetical protein